MLENEQPTSKWSLDQPWLRPPGPPPTCDDMDTVIYPDTDDEPMAENTRQFEYITVIKGGLDAVFMEDPNVFVAGDLFWYPVKGDPGTRTAPDTLVVFGRPKGFRYSYMQWREGGIAPQVVFEVLSPSNRGPALARKFEFYQQFGVQEYYTYDPDDGALQGWLRKDGHLEPISNMLGWISPLLKVRFEIVEMALQLFGPDNQRFLSYLELVGLEKQSRQSKDLAEVAAEQEKQRAEQEKQRAEQEKQRAEQEKQRAEQEKQRAEQEKQRAEQEKQRAEQEKQRAEQEKQRAERLAAQLRALGIEPEV